MEFGQVMVGSDIYYYASLWLYLCEWILKIKRAMRNQHFCPQPSVPAITIGIGTKPSDTDFFLSIFLPPFIQPANIS